MCYDVSVVLLIAIVVATFAVPCMYNHYNVKRDFNNVYMWFQLCPVFENKALLLLEWSSSTNR